MRSWPLKRSLRVGLCLEGFAAAAGALDVRVVELEAGSSQSFHPVDLCSIQIHGTSTVNEHLEATHLQDFITAVFLLLKSHMVLETRAAASHHLHSKAGKRLRLR